MATFVSQDIYDAMKAQGRDMKGVWVEGTKVQAGKRIPQAKDYKAGNALQPNMRTSLFREMLGRAPRASEHERMSTMNSKSEMQQYARQIQRQAELRKSNYQPRQQARPQNRPQLAPQQMRPRTQFNPYQMEQYRDRMEDRPRGMMQQQMEGGSGWNTYLALVNQLLYGR